MIETFINYNNKTKKIIFNYKTSITDKTLYYIQNIYLKFNNNRK